MVRFLNDLSAEDLRYILDPEYVCGYGCFEHETLGEHRTKRLVLEAWKKFGFDN